MIKQNEQKKKMKTNRCLTLSKLMNETEKKNGEINVAEQFKLLFDDVTIMIKYSYQKCNFTLSGISSRESIVTSLNGSGQQCD